MKSGKTFRSILKFLYIIQCPLNGATGNSTVPAWLSRSDNDIAKYTKRVMQLDRGWWYEWTEERDLPRSFIGQTVKCTFTFQLRSQPRPWTRFQSMQRILKRPSLSLSLRSGRKISRSATCSSKQLACKLIIISYLTIVETIEDH